MSEADTSISRRGFLGHVAGVYTTLTVVDCAPIGPNMADRIDAHRKAFRAWWALDLKINEPVRPTLITETMVEEWNRLHLEEEQARFALLEHRPASLHEAGARFAYLVEDEVVPSLTWDTDLVRLAESMIVTA